MTSSQDTEITLGTGKLLVLFFGLVGICALFFALGYSLGRKSEPTLTQASAAVPAQPAPTAAKANGGSTSTPMTFYKSVEQKAAGPELTPAADATKTDTNATPGSASPASANPTSANPASANPAQGTTQTAASGSNTPGSTPDPTTLPSAASYFVQVAAVTKQEDADALVDALKKKQYAALVAPLTADKFFRVQVGPFSDIKDAEATRTRLIGDGYSPILKK